MVLLKQVKNYCKKNRIDCDNCSIEKECCDLFGDGVLPRNWNTKDLNSVERKLRNHFGSGESYCPCGSGDSFNSCCKNK